MTFRRYFKQKDRDETPIYTLEITITFCDLRSLISSKSLLRVSIYKCQQTVMLTFRSMTVPCVEKDILNIIITT